MIVEDTYIEDFNSFIEWYNDLFPSEPVDMWEATQIYFNLETYQL